VSKLAGNPLANLAALGLGGLSGSGGASSMNASALAALAGSQLRSGANGAGVGAQQSAQQQTQEMTVPNELIGCIIGKGGTKIAEIRYLFVYHYYYYYWIHRVSVLLFNSTLK